MPQASDAAGRYRYWPALDGLRGVALVMVLGIHLQLPFMQGGFVGLDLFFVLSGFLITALLLEEWTQRGRISLRDFYVRRGLRLLPALIVMVTVVAAYAPVYLPHEACVVIWKAAAFTLFYSLNWASIYGLPLNTLTHAWTLSIEEQFYVVWPLLLIGLLHLRVSTRVRVLCVLAGVALAIWARHHFTVADPTTIRSFAGLDTRGDGLLLGCAVALTHGRLRAPLAGRIAGVLHVAGWLAAATFVWFVYAMRTTVDLPSSLTRISLTAAALIVGVVFAPNSALSRALASRPLVWLGKRSYSIYLWHFPVLVSVLPVIGWAHPAATWPKEIPYAAIRLALAFAVSLVSYRFVEKPCLRWRERWSRVRPAPQPLIARAPAAATVSGAVAEVLE